MTRLLLSEAASSSTWAPSGSLRTISYSVWAGAVVEPVLEALASTDSVMARSMSVAARLNRPFWAVISTLDRIGIVFRRSTTLWTWARAFRRAARSIVNFMFWSP